MLILGGRSISEAPVSFSAFQFVVEGSADFLIEFAAALTSYKLDVGLAGCDDQQSVHSVLALVPPQACVLGTKFRMERIDLTAF
jgi:hypothetical protein